jgi:hypothetical protein
MIQAKHCDLCEYPKRNLQIGLTCGLTDKKPDFKITCSDIKFSDSFKEYLPELLDQIKDIKKEKLSISIKFILLVALGLIIIVGSHPLLEKTFEMEFGYTAWIYFKYALFFYIVGVGLISMGLWPLNNYRNELKKMESEKREINKVLKKYGMDIETIINLKKNTNT